MLHVLPLLTFQVLSSEVPPAPPTRFEPLTETIHGYDIQDDFRWLEPLEAESEEVKA